MNRTQADLDYFIALQEQRKNNSLADNPEHWNLRADSWEQKRSTGQQDDTRITQAITYLSQRGVLQPESIVADIGCGPGRFAAAFAKQVKQVVGLDFSEQMIKYGRQHLVASGIENAQLYTCDFRTLCLNQWNYRGVFDLVFASMSPALHGIDALHKFMEMSREWCCIVTHLSGKYPLREQLSQEVFGRMPKAKWSDEWFYAVFNTLFLLGYHPETTYQHRHQEKWIRPDIHYAHYLMENILPAEEISPDNGRKILSWLESHANEEGLIQDVVDTCYGTILWNVQDRIDRPNSSN